MKKFIIASAFVIIAAMYTVTGWAGNYTIGKTSLSGDTLELSSLSVSATGHASLVSNATGAIEPGSMRLESLKASDISIELNKGSMTLKQAKAAGNVIIKSKRADKEDAANGKEIIVLRDVTATAKSAELPAGQSTIVLTGSVTVKVTEPGNPEPLMMVSGEKVEVDMKTAKIKVIGQPGSPAGLTLTPKEGDKK